MSVVKQFGDYTVSIERNPTPPTPEKVFSTIGTFGKTWTPHMFMADWKADQGWHNLRVVPQADIPMPPTAPCLHYGQEGFEGMKVTRTVGNKIALFDPMANAERFRNTAKEVDMEPVPTDLYLAGLEALLTTDRDYIPNSPANLYIRPFEVGMGPFWGAGDTDHCLFCIIATPATAPSSAPFSALVETRHSRAGPGGTGSAKVGGNYSRLTADKKPAREQFGCADVLYTAADDRELIEEFSVRNFFVEFTDNVVLTPDLRDRILPGTTRAKILQLVKEQRGSGKVHEGPYTVQKLREDIDKGVVKSVFSCGTSVGVQPLGELVLSSGERIKMPEGTFPKKLFDYFNGLRDGTVEDTHGWMVYLD